MARSLRLLTLVLFGACCLAPLGLAISDQRASWISDREASWPVAQQTPWRIEATPPSLAEMTGRVLGDGPAVAVPLEGFELRDETRWRLQPKATLLVPVERPASYLGVRLHGIEGGTVGVFWNGQELPLVGLGADGAPTYRVPPARLVTGHHRLRLEPRPTAGSAEVTLTHVVLRHGGTARATRASFHRRHQLVADFLTRGVAAAHNRQTLGGFVFDGPRAQTVRVDGRGRLSFRIQNGSPAAARFTLEPHRGAFRAVELQAFEQRDLAIELPATTHEVTLRAEGLRSGLFLWGAPHFQPSDAPRTPIVMIVLDTVRRDALGVYNPAITWTPTLDALAGRATVYNAAHTTAPWTLPAHASMLTGLYPSHHRAGVVDSVLAPTIPTLAERLRDEGWTTGGFVGAFLAGDRFGLGRGFGVFRHPGGAEAPADEVTSAALAFLRPRLDTAFFVLVNVFDAHYPYAPSASALDAVDPRATARRNHHLASRTGGRLVRGDGRAMRQLARGDLDPRDDEIELLETLYRAEIAEIDHQVGRLVDTLIEADRFDDALIIVTSDHGELFGEGGHFFHSHRLDPALIEIPLIIKYPHQTAARRVDHITSLVDLFDTVIEVADLDPRGRRDGISLLDATELERRSAVLAEEHDMPLHRLLPNVRHAEHAWAVLTPERRSIVWRDGESCAHRTLLAATWQPTDCADSWVDTDRAMVEALAQSIASTTAEQTTLDDRDRARLEALGYLDPR